MSDLRKSVEALRPCPFCGGDAKYGTVEDDPQLPQSGGWYIECTNPECRGTTTLMFPIKDSVKPLLAERWNRRAPAPGRELYEVDNPRRYIGEGKLGRYTPGRHLMVMADAPAPGQEEVRKKLKIELRRRFQLTPSGVADSYGDEADRILSLVEPSGLREALEIERGWLNGVVQRIREATERYRLPPILLPALLIEISNRIKEIDAALAGEATEKGDNHA